MHPFGNLLSCIQVGHVLNVVSGVATSPSCVNADPETIGRGMASAEGQQDEPSLGEWIAVYTCRTIFRCRLLAAVAVAVCVCG